MLAQAVQQFSNHQRYILKHEAALTQSAEPAEQCIDWFG